MSFRLLTLKQLEMKTIFTHSPKLITSLIIYLSFITISYSQAYDCNSCNSSDVKISNITLLSTTPNPAYNATTNPNVDKYLPLSPSCNTGESINGYLKIDILQNATTRYGLHIEGDLYVDGVKLSSFSNCDASEFVSGTRDKFYFPNVITWTCGQKLELRKTFVGWGNSAGQNACSDICGMGPHCNKPSANVAFVVITPLSVNFDYTSSCPINKDAETYSFNALDATHGTSGGVLPYTYSWKIFKSSDLVVPIATLSGATPTYDFSQIGAGSGSYKVTLTVIDSNAPVTSSSTTKDITVNSCCIAATSLITSNSCIGGGTVTFTQSGGTTGTWSVSGGGTINPATGVFTPSTAGCYTATYTANTCTPTTSSFVVYPAAPPAPTVNSGCGAIVVTPPTSVGGFTIQYSFDDGITWGTNTPPTVDKCSGYKIKTRYVLASACGSTPINTASSCSISPATTKILDLTAPAVNPLSNSSTVSCVSLATAPTPPTAIDNCSGTINGVLISTVDTPTPLTCVGTRVYTYEYTDTCDNKSTWVYTYTIDHTTAAVVPANGASTVQCLASATTPVPPTVTDVCGNNVSAVLATTVDAPSSLTCE